MEHFETDGANYGFHISGFPDATKEIKLSGHKAQQISELASHRSDLLIALSSLEGIHEVALDNSLVRQGLWRSAVEHCMKFFSGSDASLGSTLRKSSE